MTQLTVRTCRVSDGDLAGVLTSAAAERAGLWCFIEGPMRAGFVSVEDIDTATIVLLWSVRLFGEWIEIAARRQGFDEDMPWLARAIGYAPESWNAHAVRIQGKPEELMLFGQEDGTRRFGADFPERAHGLGNESRLVVARHELEDGPPIVQWLRIDTQEA